MIHQWKKALLEGASDIFRRGCNPLEPEVDPARLKDMHAFSGGRDIRQGIGDWMTFYNHRRPHAAHGGETPVCVYREKLSGSGPGLRPALHPTALMA